jgi:ferrous iron transport protein A
MSNSTLDKAQKGKLVTIINLPSGELRAHLIRLGITEGDSIRCIERLPGGTIVVQKNRQEIAVGYDLAKKIKIILH